MRVELPAGFRVGHWSDRSGWTGCTVVLCPEGTVGACEARGGAPGTRETDLLSPAAAVAGPNALLLTGGSAFGLAAAEGVVRWLEERGIGFPTRAARVPLVCAAVVYDLALGEAGARPGREAGYAACEAASAAPPERGSVGVGTGCTVGKLLGPASWTKGGLGGASLEAAGGARVTVLAAVNAVGEVVAEDGSVLAGIRGERGFLRSAQVVRERGIDPRPWREATTLVCALTDAALTKREAWLVARAASAGVARAVSPSATSFDGDVSFCLAAGAAEADADALSVAAAEAAAAAVRDAVLQATGAPGCPAAAEL
jgi:L-aminopeptidase/D-esterase-like protein